jgi:hypothetical protein
MVRTIAFVALGALVLSTAMMAPGIAAAKPITGNVTCILKGSAVITPGLNLANDPPVTLTKTYKSKVTFTGTLEGCAGTQTNAKAAFDHGTVVAKGVTKYAKGETQPDCIGLQNPLHPTMLKSTITFFDATGKKVGKSVATLTVGGATIGGQVSFTSTGTVTGGNSFKGETATAITNLDGPAANIGASCQGGASTTFHFTDGSSSTDIN